MKPTISPVGDCAISIDFGQVIDPKINRQIRQVIEQIKVLQLDGIIELVPTYCALLVQYDAMVYSYSDICRILEPTLQESVTDSANELVTIVEIPTVYGGEFGPDLGFVASHNHLSEAEVVSIHSGTDYLVYMLGFIPGFTYLGGMDPRIATPRLILSKDFDSCRLCRYCRGTDWYISIRFSRGLADYWTHTCDYV